MLHPLHPVPAGSLNNRFAVGVPIGSLWLNLTFCWLWHRSPRDSPERNRRQQLWPDWFPYPAPGRTSRNPAPASALEASGV